jgi:LCP family protein required for cell wall assembly
MNYQTLIAFLRKPPVAAVLSSLIPGSGHLAVDRRRALTIAIPVLTLLAVFLLIRAVAWKSLMDAAESGQLFLAFLVLDFLILGYRLYSAVDGYFSAERLIPRRKRGSAGTGQAGVVMVVVLVGVSIVPHLWFADVLLSGQGAFNNLFNPNGAVFVDGTADPHSTEIPLDTAALPSPSGSALAIGSFGYSLGNLPAFTGTATDWQADGQANILLVGIDQGPGGGRASGLRTDSMILLHVDIASGKAALFGIPRNLINIPLPPNIPDYNHCHCYPNLVDYLWTEAADWHPQYYTAAYGNNRFLRGMGALEGAVSELAGVNVDGSVVIDLPGFIAVVDALGGIDITVPKELKDTKYPILEHPGVMTIDIKAGAQHMNGTVALEYARSRESTDDYDRMKRQQLVLKAIRDAVHPCELLPRIPDLLTALGGAIWTDLPRADTGKFAALASKVGSANTASFTLDPTSTGAKYDVLDSNSLLKLRSIVAHGLDKVAGGVPTAGAGGGGGGLSC